MQDSKLVKVPIPVGVMLSTKEVARKIGMSQGSCLCRGGCVTMWVG